MEYIGYFFTHFDKTDKGFLTMNETRQFFAHILDLDFKKKASHRRLMYKIFRIVDPEDNKEVLREYVLRFFEISGFQVISKLAKEQMQLDAFNQQSELQVAKSTIPDIIVETNCESSSEGSHHASKNSDDCKCPKFGGGANQLLHPNPITDQHDSATEGSVSFSFR